MPRKDVVIAHRIHTNPKGTVLAACDASLLGQCFQEGKKELDLKKYASFYDGERVSAEELSKSLGKKFSSINLVGKETISTALPLGIFKPEHVKKISNVPYVQVYRL